MPASVGVLIAGGDLDSLTPVADAPEIAAAVGGPRRHAAQHRARDLRGRQLPRRGHALRAAGDPLVPARPLDGACGATIPRVHTPSGYPLTLAEAAPATLVSGPDPGETARRTATVAAEAVGDAITRRIYSAGNRGPGLRGGEFTVGARGTALSSGSPASASSATSALVGNASGTPPRASSTTMNGISLSWSQAAPLATARSATPSCRSPRRNLADGRLPRHRLAARGAHV